jgi:hypothetical protein
LFGFYRGNWSTSALAAFDHTDPKSLAKFRINGGGVHIPNSAPRAQQQVSADFATGGRLDWLGPGGTGPSYR